MKYLPKHFSNVNLFGNPVRSSLIEWFLQWAKLVPMPKDMYRRQCVALKKGLLLQTKITHFFH